MSTNSTISLGIVFLFAVGAPLAIIAEPKQRRSDDEVLVEHLSQRVSENLAAVSMFITDDGRLGVTGVRSLEFDEQTGHTTLKVRMHGNATTDAVVTLAADFQVDEEGTTVLLGIEAVKAWGNFVTLILRADQTDLVVANGHTIGDDDCQMRKPVPSGDPYCSGDCTVSSPNCTWALDNENNLICKCRGNIE